MNKTEQILRKCTKNSLSRNELWIYFLNAMKVHNLVELGVYKGDFAEKLLQRCDAIQKYYMIDPWRYLDDWDKPANREDYLLERYMSEALAKTAFAASKRIVLRGKTSEVVDKIAEKELDFAYIDGDHTLRGITIDLLRLFPKVKDGGWIGGDDFSGDVWQGTSRFEPTLVFPFAIYFAEAVDERIYALPNQQFLIEKNSEQPFEFIDLTGTYNDLGLRKQFVFSRILVLKLKDVFSLIFAGPRRIRQLLIKYKYKLIS